FATLFTSKVFWSVATACTRTCSPCKSATFEGFLTSQILLSSSVTMTSLAPCLTCSRLLHLLSPFAAQTLSETQPVALKVFVSPTARALARNKAAISVMVLRLIPTPFWWSTAGGACPRRAPLHAIHLQMLRLPKSRGGRHPVSFGPGSASE